MPACATTEVVRYDEHSARPTQCLKRHFRVVSQARSLPFDGAILRSSSLGGGRETAAKAAREVRLDISIVAFLAVGKFYDMTDTALFNLMLTANALELPMRLGAHRYTGYV